MPVGSVLHVVRVVYGTEWPILCWCAVKGEVNLNIKLHLNDSFYTLINKYHPHITKCVALFLLTFFVIMAGYLRNYDYEPEKNLTNFRGWPLQPACYTSKHVSNFVNTTMDKK